MERLAEWECLSEAMATFNMAPIGNPFLGKAVYDRFMGLMVENGYITVGGKTENEKAEE